MRTFVPPRLYSSESISGHVAAETRHIGAQIRRRRRNIHMSQAEAAERAGVARTTIIRLEAGDPTVSIATALAVIYVVRLELVTGLKTLTLY